MEAGEKGSALRFKYCAKAGKKERGEGNNHPTVKPLKLLRYLVKLIAPPKNAIILDPFLGSGSTAVACIKEKVSFIGIEKEEDYVKIAWNRIVKANRKQ